MKKSSEIYNVMDGSKKIASIQLFNIDYYPRLSDETYAFNADMKLVSGNERYVFRCSNDGHGGSTYFDAMSSDYNNAMKLLETVDRVLSTQRDDLFYAYAKEEGLDVSKLPEVKLSVENVVNNLLSDYLIKNNL